ncbi:hypothetical protein Pyn_30416 [Prunus yedoensis var. nudiflora]|uniref:Uncharacterized protein n=1 Tax=Prunus yedoensis var. nudiflora TaxID=2094558 RepID=A0A314ZIH1_PRUYE|nr:hypothetical protein Pyn_30416 [Prunus yedoensis var. nudiflora]
MGDRGISQSRGRDTTNNGAGGRGIAFNVRGGLGTPPNTGGMGGNPQNAMTGRGIAFNFGGGLGTPPNVDGKAILTMLWGGQALLKLVKREELLLCLSMLGVH